MYELDLSLQGSASFAVGFPCPNILIISQTFTLGQNSAASNWISLVYFLYDEKIFPIARFINVAGGLLVK